MAKKNNNMIGSWAFTIGIVVAVLLGVFQFSTSATAWLMLALAVIGIVVGLLNVTSDETQTFLSTAAIMVFVSWAGTQTLAQLAQTSTLMAVVVQMLSNLNVLFIPATIVVAIKAVFALARD
jgi:hypothetical protein